MIYCNEKSLSVDIILLFTQEKNGDKKIGIDYWYICKQILHLVFCNWFFNK